MLIFSADKEKPLKCPPGFTLSDSFCFYLDRTLRNFWVQVNHCSTIGGYIVKVESQEKNSAMNKFVQNEMGNNSETVYAYLGLRDTVGDNNLNNYRWTSDNSPMTFSNFRQSEPDNTVEYCVTIGSEYKWFDIMCTNVRWAICEASVIDESLLP